MSEEMYEAYAGLREVSKQKRRDNRESSAELLKRFGVSFELKNKGAHLIVADRWDFWPGTGLFIDRKNQKRGRGVFRLLKVMRQQGALPWKGGPEKKRADHRITDCDASFDANVEMVGPDDAMHLGDCDIGNK